jgi:Thermostable hemolysin
MVESAEFSLIRRRYHDVFSATITPGFGAWMHSGAHGASGAALGYRRACEELLFLECYLDQPVEKAVSSALGRAVSRAQIIEIGNFASDNALAMIELWGAAANDLAGGHEVAVATLTAPLRSMFGRIGLPITVLAPARPERLGGNAAAWGGYYELDPQVCAGIIADGQQAINAFQQRRLRRAAA